MNQALLSNAPYLRNMPSSVATNQKQIGDTIDSNVIVVDFARRSASTRLTPSATPAKSAVPEWRKIAIGRLAALHRLADGWDGASSVAISGPALAKADRILGLAFDGVVFAAPPAAVPCGDGSVQLEWWLTDTRFELLIEPDGHLEGWAQDRKTGHEVEAEGSAAIQLLSKWSRRLTADKLINQA